MTLQEYIQQKQDRAQAQKTFRPTCPNCRRPEVSCFCSAIRSFRPGVKFIILIHRHEARRSVATGRMAHLCLENSQLLEGTDFSEHSVVQSLIGDEKNYCVVLYPGLNAIDLTGAQGTPVAMSIPDGKQLVVFLIDGTWAQAKRMRRLSRNLHSLPSIRFTPTILSRFQVRKQPADHCYSTIEAIHYLLNRLEPQFSERHENLLEVFEVLVKKQLHFQTTVRALRGFRRGQRTPFPRNDFGNQSEA